MSTMSTQLRKVGKTRKERTAVVRRAFKPDLYDRLHFELLHHYARRQLTKPNIARHVRRLRPEQGS